MFSCPRLNRKSYIVIPTVCIFLLVIFNISQLPISWSQHPCQPRQCDHEQVHSFIQDSSFANNVLEEAPTWKIKCNRSRSKRKKEVLFMDILNSNSTLNPLIIGESPNCPPCISEFQSIDVRVNNKETVTGLMRERDSAVFIPFQFIQKHFEVYGHLQNPSRKKKGILIWSHANVNESQVSTYSPVGTYMNLVYTSVETRERVKCISTIEGVPVSTQWSAAGYFYPTQIAQFGLSHFSKHLTSPKPIIQVIEDGFLNDTTKWIIEEGASMKSVYDKTVGTHVIFFDSRGIQEDGITYSFDTNLRGMNLLCLSVKFRNNGQVSVTVLASNKQRYIIRYSVSESMWVKYSFPDIYYGLNQKGTWLHLTRNLDVDLQKGLGSNNGKRVKLVQTTVYKIIELTFHGTGWFDNVTVRSTAHERQFLAAANWLVKTQDKVGGWRVNVTRKVFEGLAIKPGWYSAMSQGQAISLLCRAYNVTGNHQFLHSAIEALKLFHVPSKENGIVAKFMDTYIWYEEYPTQPPLFVLNGFMYSLIGLHDLSVIGKGTMWGNEASELLHEGLRSLDAMLPLYDSGHETFYDLRHFSVVGSHRPPNRARWSYHVLHLEQLAVLRQFHTSEVIDKIIERWRRYLVGNIASHN